MLIYEIWAVKPRGYFRSLSVRTVKRGSWIQKKKVMKYKDLLAELEGNSTVAFRSKSHSHEAEQQD